MSEWIITSSVLIACLLALRRIFRSRISARVQYALWLLAALRLLIPFTFFESRISVLNLTQQARVWLAQVGEEFPGLEALYRRQEQNKTAGSSKEAENVSLEHEGGSAAGGLAGIAAVGQESGEEGGAESSAWMGAGALEGFSAAESLGREGGRQERDMDLNLGEKEGSGRLVCLWLIGVLLCAGMVSVSNLLFYRRLCCSRSRIKNARTGCRLPVYATSAVDMPCLFGVVRPAIYLTAQAAADERARRQVLLHESIHYRHRDHLWALVRMICLSIHWYNPLVWLAVSLSRQDCELACDEGVLQNRTDQERIDYGRTLLAFAASATKGRAERFRCCTGISGGKKQLKERILLVTLGQEKCKIAAAPVVLALLAAMITFTGSLGVQAMEENLVTSGASLGDSSEDGLENILNVPGAVSGIFSEDAGWDEGIHGDRITADLNFDGCEDFCLPAGGEGMEPHYYCYLWNPQKGRFEQKGVIPGVRADEEAKLLVNTETDEEGRRLTRYYRFDQEGSLHLVRYVEENPSPGAVFSYLDLTCCEVSYSLPFVYGGELSGSMEQTDSYIYWAKQALTELYEWSGTKLDTVCFAVTKYGDFNFGNSVQDVKASRTFYSRCYGSKAGFEESIENMNLSTERTVWYSPVTQWRVPDKLNNMTDVEVVEWYFDRWAAAEGEERKSIQTSYENAYVVCTEADHYYELELDPATREIRSVYGPYDGYPGH